MRATRTSSSGHIVKVDRRLNRPLMSGLEALVSDDVHTDAHQSAPETSQSRWQRIARRAYESAPESSQSRWQRIARRASELAYQRGFAPELVDWLQAEKEVDAAEQQKQAAPEFKPAAQP